MSKCKYHSDVYEYFTFSFLQGFTELCEIQDSLLKLNFKQYILVYVAF